MLLLFSALTAWITADAFANELLTDIQQSHDLKKNINKFDNHNSSKNILKWPCVYSCYGNVKELCFYTNEAFGSIFTLYLANSLVTQAAGLDAAILTPGLTTKFRIIFFIFVSAGISIIAADVCDKVR